MSEDVPAGETVAQAVDRAKAAATRRRWVSLAELVGVAGLVVAALGLWLTWSDRREARAIRADEQAAKREAAAAERRQIGLIATDNGGNDLGFKGVECALQTSDITFPGQLDVPAQNTVIEHRIETDWFAKPLLKLTDGEADHRRGRLPVRIDSDCIGEGGLRSESAIYDLIWEIQPHLFGHVVKLRGMVMRERSSSPARLDAIWAAEKPKAAP